MDQNDLKEYLQNHLRLNVSVNHFHKRLEFKLYIAEGIFERDTTICEELVSFEDLKFD
jgi:hypothetical protein